MKSTEPDQPGECLLSIVFVFYMFCPNLLDGGIHKDRASAKQSLCLVVLAKQINKT